MILRRRAIRASIFYIQAGFTYAKTSSAGLIVLYKTRLVMSVLDSRYTDKLNRIAIVVTDCAKAHIRQTVWTKVGHTSSIV